MNNFLKTENENDLNDYNTQRVSPTDEIEVGEHSTTLNEYSINGVKINDVNFNDIHRENEECDTAGEIDENSSTRKNNKKKKRKKIEYVFYDVESLYCNYKTSENVLDLSTIKSETLFEGNVKKKSKKENAKKKIKLFKKKYKILPEHILNNDTNYENTINQDLSQSSKKNKHSRRTNKKEIETTQQNKSTHSRSVENIYFLDVLKIIVLVLSIFSLGAFGTVVTKFVFFVEKLNYAHVITLFHFLVVYLILKMGVFFLKLESSTNLSRKEYIKFIISVAALLGVDTIAGNGAYAFLEIPIITVFKSSSLILIYFLSVRLGLKELRCSLVCSILTIFTGTLMSMTTLKINSSFGLFLLIISVVSSSFKWVLMNLLLRTTSIKPHVMILHVNKVAVLIIAIPSLLIDLSKIINDYSLHVITAEQITTTIILLVLNSLAYIFLFMAELYLISLTSSVTLSIVGIGREAVMLIIGALFFGDKFGLASVIGISVSMLGTFLYGYVSN